MTSWLLRPAGLPRPDAARGFLGNSHGLVFIGLPDRADRGGGHRRGDGIRPGIVGEGGLHPAPQLARSQVPPPARQLDRGGDDRRRSERKSIPALAGPVTEPRVERRLCLVIALGAMQETDQVYQPVLVKVIKLLQELDGLLGTSLVDLNVGPGGGNGRGQRRVRRLHLGSTNMIQAEQRRHELRHDKVRRRPVHPCRPKLVGRFLVFVQHVRKPSPFKVEIRVVAYRLRRIEPLLCLIVFFRHSEAGYLPPPVSDTARILPDQRSENLSCLAEASLPIGDISEFTVQRRFAGVVSLCSPDQQSRLGRTAPCAHHR
jgi:hypothetical protein